MTDVELYEPVPVPGGNGEPTPEQYVRRWLTTKRSGHTRSSYGADLGVYIPRPGVEKAGPQRRAPRVPPWLDWCATLGVDPLGPVLEEHVALWARAMEAAKLTPATVARRLATVSSWYDWMTVKGYAPGNPAQHLDRPYVDPDISKTPGLTKEQALRFQHHADTADTPMRLRNSALVGLLLYTGARVSEMTGATLSDLGMDRGHRVLWVTRKGGARQPLPLTAPATERLDRYLAARGDVDHRPALPGDVAAGTRPLIATSTGKPVRDAYVWVTFRAMGLAAGLPPELVAKWGPHGARHTFSTLALDAGVPERDLQDGLGHKDPRSTRRYDRARGRLERFPGYRLAAYMSEGGEEDDG